ncbi:MAG: AbrB/MazE/SpoVT family DNA-binding domain-containing protein [Anaerolineales bacterium]|nr:AbrB/MazE/SpoVT family DNA-binding domain-containing protein [Anaerolineales bacterium]
MSETTTVQMAQRGLVTLPKSLREMYHLNPGDTFTLIDVGGVFILSPRRTEINRMADKIGQELRDRGESLESMLAALREAREQYAGED